MHHSKGRSPIFFCFCMRSLLLTANMLAEALLRSRRLNKRLLEKAHACGK